MKFYEKIERYKEKVNDEIYKCLERSRKESSAESLGKAYEIMQRYMEAGGKRIRPAAMISAFEAIANADEKIYLPAAGIEFLHNSTLCHDDIMDEDDMRRNTASCHKALQDLFLSQNSEEEYQGDIFSRKSARFGVSNAIILGNIFNFLGYKCFAECDFPDAVKQKAISRISATMIEVNKGQILDMAFEKEKIDEQLYMDMISRKTAYLLGAAFELGAIFAEAEDNITKAFFDYGFNLGIAFQIVDDLMDLDENMQKGHAVGSDVRKGKRTIIAIKALEKCSAEERRFLERGNFNDEEMKRAIDIYKKTGAAAHARELANDKIRKAKEALLRLRLDNTEFFEMLAEYVVRRKA